MGRLKQKVGIFFTHKKKKKVFERKMEKERDRQINSHSERQTK
jgi:hypothetical protein